MIEEIKEEAYNEELNDDDSSEVSLTVE